MYLPTLINIRMMENKKIILTYYISIFKKYKLSNIIGMQNHK